MSPTEHELRAALHDGEGEPLDAGALISHAHGVRRQRQRRIYSALGAAAAVVVIGGGAAALSSYSNGSHDEAGGAAAKPDRSVAAVQAPSAGAEAPQAEKTTKNQPGVGPEVATSDGSQPAACGSALGRLALPPGGDQKALFNGKVARILVCSYAMSPSARPRSELLSGTQAAALARTMEAAPARSAPQCPEPSGVRTLVLHPADAHGRGLHPVEVTLACESANATNGAAVRAVPVAELPASVRQLLNP